LSGAHAASEVVTLYKEGKPIAFHLTDASHEIISTVKTSGEFAHEQYEQALQQHNTLPQYSSPLLNQLQPGWGATGKPMPINPGFQQMIQQPVKKP